MRKTTPFKMLSRCSRALPEKPWAVVYYDGTWARLYIGPRKYTSVPWTFVESVDAQGRATYSLGLHSIGGAVQSVGGRYRSCLETTGNRFPHVKHLILCDKIGIES